MKYTKILCQSNETNVSITTNDHSESFIVNVPRLHHAYEELKTKHDILQKNHTALRKIFNEQNTCLGEHEENVERLKDEVSNLSHRNIKLNHLCTERKHNLTHLHNEHERCTEYNINLLKENETLKEYNSDMTTIATNQVFSLYRLVKENEWLKQYKDKAVVTLAKSIEENEVLKESLCAASTKIIDQGLELTKVKKQKALTGVLSENETLRHTLKKVSAEILQKALDLNIRESEIRKLKHNLQNINFNFIQRGKELNRMRIQLRKEGKTFRINKRCKETLRLTRNYVSELEEDLRESKDISNTKQTIINKQGKKIEDLKYFVDKYNGANNGLKKDLKEMTEKKNHFKSEFHRVNHSNKFNKAIPHLTKVSKQDNESIRRAFNSSPPAYMEDEHFKGHDEGELDITILAIIEIDNTQE